MAGLGAPCPPKGGRREAFLIVGLGELLWDLLPEGKKPGGAPANFAYHARALGDEGLPVSRIGADSLGRELRGRLDELGLPGKYVQVDPQRPTGTVHVALDSRGIPTFTITPEVAWDHLAWDRELEALAARADAVCFGSLAQRGSTSRATIRAFLSATRPSALRVFDVNLRQHWYSQEVLRDSLERSSIVKLNEAELPVVLEALGLPGGETPRSGRKTSRSGGRRARALENGCRALRDAFGLALVCLTLGAEGSLLCTAPGCFRSPGVKVEVADTVGAGDAFTAVLCHHWLRGSPLERTAEAANRYGAWVASQAGPTPTAPAAVLAGVR
jgi:fructokinase